MEEMLQNILNELQIQTYLHENLRVLHVKSKDEGLKVTAAILQRLIDRQTVLFLSGGSTPEPLYHMIAEKPLDESIRPAAVALVDERYASEENTNEKMIKDTGLLTYFLRRNIPFYGVLQKDLNREDTAMQYDETVRYLLHNFPKSVGIMGIGSDGHTAGIPIGRQKIEDRGQNFVAEFDDFPGEYKERITLTFLALSMLDCFIVLAFGKEKKKAFEKMFTEGSEEDIPARFYLRPEIARKTLLITDQKI